MTTMRKLLITLFFSLLCTWSSLQTAHAGENRSTFVAIAFHDVVDDHDDVVLLSMYIILIKKIISQL
jgi:hypothetical protein